MRESKQYDEGYEFEMNGAEDIPRTKSRRHRL